MTYRIPARLGHVTLPPAEGRPVSVYLMQLPDGDALALQETSALIWSIAAEGEPDVPGALAELLDVPVEAIAEETRAHLGFLVSQGLLDWVP